MNVRLPGKPLVILQRVQAGDVHRILDDMAAGQGPRGPGALQDRGMGPPHRARELRRGLSQHSHWHDVPFFKPQKKIVLRNCGLISPDDIEEYIAIGGYQSLYKVLIDANPELVIEQIKAAKLRGRGGAGFLTGLKWEFLRKAAGRPEVHHLQCGRRRPRRLHEPQRDRKRSAFAARRHDHRRLRHGRDRGHHLCARRVSAGGAPPEPRHRAGAPDPACWATTSWGADSISTFEWWKARALSCAARRRR